MELRTTNYFKRLAERKDRAWIKTEWIEQALRAPLRKQVQPDGRIRCWAQIPQANNRYLRVVTLEDGETVHNAFFDRNFRP